MPNESAAAMTAATRAIGSDDLAQGLLLVQASAIKVVRLQLAMERRDRRAAIETVDDLMRLDRRISAFLDDLPVCAATVSAAREEVAAQGRALAREKFALAAGTAGPRLATPRPGWVDPSPQPPPPRPAGPPVDPVVAADPDPATGKASTKRVAALLALALASLAVGASVFLAAGGPGLPGWLPAIDGVLP